jgi:hypothetical protein
VKTPGRISYREPKLPVLVWQQVLDFRKKLTKCRLTRSPPSEQQMVQVVFYTVPPHVRAMRAVFIIVLGYIVYKYIVQHQGQPPGVSYSAR